MILNGGGSAIGRNISFATSCSLGAGLCMPPDMAMPSSDKGGSCKCALGGRAPVGGLGSICFALVALALATRARTPTPRLTEGAISCADRTSRRPSRVQLPDGAHCDAIVQRSGAQKRTLGASAGVTAKPSPPSLIGRLAVEQRIAAAQEGRVAATEAGLARPRSAARCRSRTPRSTDSRSWWCRASCTGRARRSGSQRPDRQRESSGWPVAVAQASPSSPPTSAKQPCFQL